MAKDKAGNSLKKASNLNGLSSTTLTRKDFVGVSDRDDLYHFKLTGSSSVSINLFSIQNGANADLELFGLKKSLPKKIAKLPFSDLKKKDIRRYLNPVAASRKGGQKSETINTTLATGEYYLRVHQRKGNTRYQLGLTANTIDVEDRFYQGNEVKSLIFANDTVDGSIASTDTANSLQAGSYADDYLLSGVTGNQEVKIGLSSSEFNPRLQIVDDQTGELIAENDANGSQDSSLTLKVQPGVQYSVRVTNSNPNTLGNYILKTTTASSIVGTISPNQTVNGNLAETDLWNPTRDGSYSDDYALKDISADQQLKISLNSTGFDGYLQLVNADTGAVLGFNDYANRPEDTTSELDFMAQSGVNYVVRVTSFDEMATGNYTLGVTPASRTINPDQTIFGTLADGDAANTLRSGSLRDDYLLSGTSAGQQIQFVVESDDFNTHVQLVNADTEQLIAEGQDADRQSGDLGSKLNVTVQPSVNYLVRVTSSQTGSGGNYTLNSIDRSYDWFSKNLRDSGIQATVRQKAADGTIDANDMQALFGQVGTNASLADQTKLADLRHITTNSSRFNIPAPAKSLLLQSLIPKSGALRQAPLKPAANPLSTFHRSKGNTQGDKGTISFDNVALKGTLFGSTDASPTGGVNKPKISQIDQGGFGDCVLLASLASAVQQGGEQFIRQMVKDNGNGTYSVRFYSAPGVAEWVTVDNLVPVETNAKTNNTGGRRLFGTTADGHDSKENASGQSGFWTDNKDNWPIWVPIVEKAYAIWKEQKREDWRTRNKSLVPIKQRSGWDLIGNGLSDVTTLMNITGKSTKKVEISALILPMIDSAISSNQCMIIGTAGASEKEPNNRIVGSHEYTVKGRYSDFADLGDQTLVVIRNPWGKDTYYDAMTPKLLDETKRKYPYNSNSWYGDKWDGLIRLPLNDLKTYFKSCAISQPIAGANKVATVPSFSLNSDPVTAPPAQDPNGSFSKATDLGAVPLIDRNDISDNSPTSPKTRTDTIGNAEAYGVDQNDYYRFSLTQAGNLSVSISQLTQNADLKIYNSNFQEIGSSTLNGTGADTVHLSQIGAGTYYARVFPGVSNAKTSYKLSMIATPGIGLFDYDQDDTFATGTLIQPLQTVNGYVSSLDKNDFYKFTIENTGGFISSIEAGSDYYNGQLQLFNSAFEKIGYTAFLSGTGQFTGLNPGDTYYLRVYATTQNGAEYTLSVEPT